MRASVLLLLFVLALAVPMHATPPYQNQQVLVPAYQGTSSPGEQILADILKELKGLREDVRGLKAPGAGLSLQKAVTDYCAKCHAAAVAEELGDGFVMLEKDGKLTEFSVAERRRIAREVDKGKMPKGGVLPDEVKQLFLNLKGESK